MFDGDYMLCWALIGVVERVLRCLAVFGRRGRCLAAVGVNWWR